MEELEVVEPVTLVRVCRKCSVQSQVEGAFCPNCGRSFEGGHRPSRRTVLIVALVVLALVGAGIALAVVKQNQAEERRDRAVAAAAAKAKAEQEAAERAAAAKEAADQAERDSRAEMVKELERNITKSARKAVSTGVLDGPILYSSCTATGGGSTDDLTALTGTFDCLAANKENADNTISGYSYGGTVEWETGTMTWQLGG